MAETERTYTVLEMVEAQRAAFMTGIRRAHFDRNECEARKSTVGAYGYADGPRAVLYLYRLDGLAAECYPLPKVERPRVVADPHESHVKWRVGRDSGGKPALEARDNTCDFDVWPVHCRMESRYYVTPARIAIWSDLFMNPTEWVDAPVSPPEEAEPA